MTVPFILTHPTFENVKQAANHIVEQLNKEGVRPNKIVALARGGAILGVILSHRLNVPLVIVAYSSKAGKGDDRNHDNILPVIENSTVLIVDDLTDSGHSMDEVSQHFLKFNNEVKTATMYAKEGGKLIPDFYWHWLQKTAPFIHFPWEV